MIYCKVRKCIGCFCQNILENLIYPINKELNLANSGECIMVLKSDEQALLGTDQEKHQRVWLDPGATHGKHMEQFLIKKSKCVTLTYLGSNLEHLTDNLKLSRYIRNHVNIYIGNSQPDDDTLLSIVRPLAWLTDDQVTSKVLSKTKILMCTTS